MLRTADKCLEVMWRRTLLSDLPWERGRVVLRAATCDDASMVHALANDHDVRRFLGGPLRASLENTTQKLESSPGTLYIVSVEADDVGDTAFIENKKAGGIDILIALLPAFQGKGYGREVLDLMVAKWQAHFPDKPITVSTQTDNSRAIKLLESAGFQRTSQYQDAGLNYAVYAVSC